jgi:NAD(P)H-hydrate epimerase
MFEILTADEMTQADRAAIEGGLTGIQLMDAAGRAVAAAVVKKYDPCPVLVLCGPGNNGGDGFVVAAVLKKKGWPVRVACTVKKNALKGDAATAAKKWDGDTESLNSNLSVHKTELVIDAIYGAGFRGGLEPEMVTLFDKIRTRNIPVVAVDVPTGVDATATTIADGALQATMTITFCRRKIAHVLLPARAFCGAIQVASIGIDDKTVAALDTTLFHNNPALWLNNFPLPGADTHKYDRGHVVVYGGSRKTGAARLAASAAQRAGAGAVTIACRPDAQQVYALHRASIMTEVWTNAEDFKSILRDERKNVCVIGPGAEPDASMQSAIDAALVLNKTVIFDADVFTAYKDNASALFSRLSPARHVMTPHMGEFERLFPALSGSKLERARAAAKTANAVIVLKGSDTVIAAPDGTAVINTNAPATLATAGSGDVLAGMIAGFASGGMNPFMASTAAVWVHAEAARAHGLGLSAEDIIFNISHALNYLFGTGPANS